MSKITKEDILAGWAAGKTNAQMERDHVMKPNSIYRYIKKWNLVKPPEAVDAPHEPTPGEVEDMFAEAEPKLEAVQLDSRLIRLEAENETLNLRLEDAAGTIKKLEADNRHVVLTSGAAYEQLQSEIEALKENLASAESDRNALLEVIEREVIEPKKAKERAAVADLVNHPQHYTAGEIECIDAIASATVGLQGIQAYCTGCIIKYAWRWHRKGGIEDLQKAMWYAKRLIEGVEHEKED